MNAQTGQTTSTTDLTRLIAAAQATTIAVNNLNQTLSSSDFAAIAPAVTGLGLKINGVPVGATIVSSSSGEKSNATATTTLSTVGTATLYITGFDASYTGAAAASVTSVVISGVDAGSVYFILSVPTPAASTAGQFTYVFNPPQPASSGVISAQLGATGTGSTSALNIYGFYV